MDITMCKGQGCPVRENCKRFNAEPGMMQSYFVEIPGDYKEVIKTFPDPKHNTRTKVWECDMFWGEQQDAIMDVLQKAVGG